MVSEYHFRRVCLYSTKTIRILLGPTIKLKFADLWPTWMSMVWENGKFSYVYFMGKVFSWSQKTSKNAYLRYPEFRHENQPYLYVIASIRF